VVRRTEQVRGRGELRLSCEHGIQHLHRLGCDFRSDAVSGDHGVVDVARHTPRLSAASCPPGPLRAACTRGIARGTARVNGLPGFALAPYVRIGPYEGPRTKEANMSIGLGIFLFVVGAILTFAL